MTAPAPAVPPPADDSLVLSYLALRKAIGIIGIALPFVLAAGKWIFEGPGIQPSISAYYYTDMRNVLVGSLCAIGVFLMAYRGYARADAIAGRLACAFAVATALFPTAPEPVATPHETLIGRFHLGFAASLFLTLAYFCLCLFRRTDPAKKMTDQKVWRNRIYTVCGWTIIAAIAAIAAVKFLLTGNDAFMALDPIFWLEALAIFAFGWSWFVKGEAILKDQPSGDRGQRSGAAGAA
ncbi:MAG TPA: hypothetical protein VMT93_04360 [Gemmatimonadaceae bacterium]|nr:hypothetical protein [Gemmatimonadaceae bacterium]